MQTKSLTVLGKKEVEGVESSLGIDLTDRFVLRDWEGGIWVASAALSKVDFSRINVRSIGMRVAYVDREGRLVRTKSSK